MNALNYKIMAKLALNLRRRKNNEAGRLRCAARVCFPTSAALVAKGKKAPSRWKGLFSYVRLNN